MIDRTHKALSVVQQCRLMKVNRSSLYYSSKAEQGENQDIIRRIDQQFLETPYYGSRQMTFALRREGFWVNRKRIRRLMKVMGLQGVFQAPRTSQRHKGHQVYPYLLRDRLIDRPNQVWCADITYIPVQRGFLYLVAVMDWYSRSVLSFRVSNTMDTSFCVEALEEALVKYGTPSIFNTDQGSQFTSLEFTGLLKNHGIQISMDGQGRWKDNVLIERFWRSLKYECVYLNPVDQGHELKALIQSWIDHYNRDRPHSALGGRTPFEVYASEPLDILPLCRVQAA
jgi:putative transposase